jgi:capsular polysaccharide biosynthesis protein
VELKAYFAVIMRRWYLVALVPALVLLGVIYQFVQAEPAYTASARLSIVRTEDQPDLPEFRYDGYYRYLASEFAVDDFVELVRGNVFAADVSARIKQETGNDIAATEIQQAIQSERKHRILNIDVTSADQDRAVLIAAAAADTLEAKGIQYFTPNLPPSAAAIQTVQTPESAASNLTKQRLVYVLQLLVAVFAGLVIAFLVDYLDDTIRSRDAVTATLGVPVIGTIPSGRSTQ